MRHKLLIFIPLFILSFQVLSQSADKPYVNRNFLYAGSIELFLNTFQAGYERMIGNNSIQILAGFKLAQKEEIIRRIGGNSEIQYRINMLYDKQGKSKNPRYGSYNAFPYFAPFLAYRYEEITEEPEDDRLREKTIVNSIFGGAGFGLRVNGEESRFTLNVFAGGGMKYSDTGGNGKYNGIFETAYTGLAPKFGLQVGIAF